MKEIICIYTCWLFCVKLYKLGVINKHFLALNTHICMNIDINLYIHMCVWKVIFNVGFNHLNNNKTLMGILNMNAIGQNATNNNY